MNTWPFPIGGPPAQDRGHSRIPFNPNNHDEAPW
jgi:hypothetical protein